LLQVGLFFPHDGADLLVYDVAVYAITTNQKQIPSLWSFNPHGGMDFGSYSNRLSQEVPISTRPPFLWAHQSYTNELLSDHVVVSQ
jgi:hypothetical protein